MKKFIVTLLVLLGMLFSMLPTLTALAKKETGVVSISVKNRTGGIVTLILVDQNGYRHVFSYEPGMFNSSLLEGRYSFYANTPCGVQSGVLNLNVNKHLDFYCAKEGREIHLYVPVPAVPSGSACRLMFWISNPGQPKMFYWPNANKVQQDSYLNNNAGGWDCYDGVTPFFNWP